MKLSRRKIAANNKMLTERLEECQVLLSALALAHDGALDVSADAMVQFSLAIEHEHAFAIRRLDNGGVRVTFTPTVKRKPESDIVSMRVTEDEAVSVS